MASGGAFKNGAGSIIQFTVSMFPDSSQPGGFRTQVDFDYANKDLQCQIYGQLIAQPTDPIGQQNFINALAGAMVQEAQSPGAPPQAAAAYGYGATAASAAQAFAEREATVGDVRKACSWGEAANTPNT